MAWPTLVFALAEVGRELALWRLAVGLPVLVATWAASTLPPVLITLWLLAAPRREAAPESLAAALEALGRAERLARDQAVTLARVEEALARQAPAPPGEAR